MAHHATTATVVAARQKAVYAFNVLFPSYVQYRKGHIPACRLGFGRKSGILSGQGFNKRIHIIVMDHAQWVYFHRRGESVRTLRPLRSVNSVVFDHSGTTPAIVAAARWSDLRRTFDRVTNGIELSLV